MNPESEKVLSENLPEDVNRLSQMLKRWLRPEVHCRKCGILMGHLKKTRYTKAGQLDEQPTGICFRCQPSSKVVEVQKNGSYVLIKRRDRRKRSAENESKRARNREKNRARRRALRSGGH